MSNVIKNENELCRCGSGISYKECCGKDKNNESESTTTHILISQTEIESIRTENELLKSQIKTLNSNKRYEVWRFENRLTKQIHRFIPLFKKDWEGKIIGVCLDSCKVRRWTNTDTPLITKGQIIEVNSNLNRIVKQYKGETIYDLERVFDSPVEQDNYGIKFLQRSHNSLHIGYGYWSYRDIDLR